jgi:putative ABC transport system substrate-binding protein
VIDRRAFVVGGLAALAAPLGAGAQPGVQPVAKIARFGCVDLGVAILNAEYRQAFTDGLADHGWDNVLIEYQWANEWAPAQVTVVAFVNDPVASGVVANVARPDRGMAWLSLQLPETSAKRVALLRAVAPTVARIAILTDPVISNPRQAGISTDARETEAAALKLGVPAHVIEVASNAELEGIFAAIAQERGTGVIVQPSALMYAYRARIARLAIRHHLPTVTSVETGGLISYGPDPPDLARRTAYFMDKLLRGAKPVDVPVDEPTKFKLTINRNTAKALGLTIPPSLLLRADQVIE